MYTDPAFWTSITDVIRTIGILGMLGALAWIVKLVWGARGRFDDFVAGQAADRELAKKTLDGIEAARKTAMEEVEKATAHGEARANELRIKIEENQSALDKIAGNHLAHIQLDIAEANVKYDRLIGIGTKQLEISQSMKESLAILVDRSERK
jgi:hypothetical protein